MKRRSARFVAGLTATVHLPGGDAEAEASDLSRTGVLLEGDLPLKSGNRLELTLHSAADDLRLRLTGRVSRVDAGPPLRQAIRFDAPDAAGRQTLEALVARVVEGMNPAPLTGLTHDSSVAEVRQALDKVPVVHRVALARRAGAKERHWLKHDPSPQVIEALFRNPQLTVPETREVLRRNDLLPPALDLVSRDARWTGDPEIMLRVATHPRVSLQTATRLMESFPPPLRQRALATSGLHDALRLRFAPRLG